MSAQPLEMLVPEQAPRDAGTGAAVVRAAGVLPWRRKKGALQVAVVHRPRYDDWSWPKGKLDRGEDWAAAAARETLEETGLAVRLGARLPAQTYPLGRIDGRPSSKRVEYWAGTPVGGTGQLEHEIDEVSWLTPAKAARRLTYPRDRIQLEALVSLADNALLDTWTLLIVRHAKSVSRKSWHRRDMVRPLTTVGKRRAVRMVPILTAYAPERIVTSPSTRCHDTLAPFAQEAVVPLSTKHGLSEEGYAERPEKVAKHMTKLFVAGRSVAVCTHGPVLHAVVDQLSAHTDSTSVQRALTRIRTSSMDKGEVLACTVVGRAEQAQIITTARHRIPR